MALATADIYRRDKLLNQLKNVWGNLSAEEQSAVEVVVHSIILRHDKTEEELFAPLTDSELLERIDQGIADADAGEFMDSVEFERELASDFGLA